MYVQTKIHALSFDGRKKVGCCFHSEFHEPTDIASVCQLAKEPFALVILWFFRALSVDACTWTQRQPKTILLITIFIEKSSGMHMTNCAGHYAMHRAPHTPISNKNGIGFGGPKWAAVAVCLPIS